MQHNIKIFNHMQKAKKILNALNEIQIYYIMIYNDHPSLSLNFFNFQLIFIGLNYIFISNCTFNG